VIRHKYMSVFGIQYHSEYSHGPWDSTYLFKDFLKMVKKGRE